MVKICPEVIDMTKRLRFVFIIFMMSLSLLAISVQTCHAQKYQGAINRLLDPKNVESFGNSVNSADINNKSGGWSLELWGYTFPMNGMVAKLNTDALLNFCKADRILNNSCKCFEAEKDPKCRLMLDSVSLYYENGYKALVSQAEKYKKTISQDQNAASYLEANGFLFLLRTKEGEMGGTEICNTIGTDIDFSYYLCRFVYGCLTSQSPTPVAAMLFKTIYESSPVSEVGVYVYEEEGEDFVMAMSKRMFDSALWNLQEKKYDRAWELIDYGAAMGNNKCEILRAYCTMNGLGTKEDKTKAMKIIEEAASKDNNWDAANILEMVKQASKK